MAGIMIVQLEKALEAIQDRLQEINEILDGVRLQLPEDNYQDLSDAIKEFDVLLEFNFDRDFWENA